MIDRLLVATRNQGKLRELSRLLAGLQEEGEAPILTFPRGRGKGRDASSPCPRGKIEMGVLPVPLLSLADAGIEEEVEETGSTLEENAVLKATTYARLSGLPTLADDSGLEVDALDGAPGPLSSRYAGDAERIAFLLGKLHNIPEERWTARFRCVIAVSLPGRPVELYAGECTGRLVREPRGSNGFGYDPIFLLPEMGRTMAELTSEEKDRVSHRGEAARRAAAALFPRLMGEG